MRLNIANSKTEKTSLVKFDHKDWKGYLCFASILDLGKNVKIMML